MPRLSLATARTAVSRARRVGWRPGGVYRLPTAEGVVPYRVVRSDASGDARPLLVVGLHGFGSDEAQIASLVGLDLPGPVVYLAPRAGLADGDGFSWFEISIGADGTPEAGDVGPALARVHAFAEAARRAWRSERSVLVGYSQGGALALTAAVSAPGTFDAVASVSGGLSPRPPTLGPGVPLFVAHGTLDPAVPAADVRQAVKVLDAGGRDVTYHESAAPHVVTVAQRAALSAWLRARLFDVS